MGLWLIASFDLGAIRDACPHAKNTCLREPYVYGPHTTSWLFNRNLLVQSNRILLSCPPTPVITWLDSLSIQVYAAWAWKFSSAEARHEIIKTCWWPSYALRLLALALLDPMYTFWNENSIKHPSEVPISQIPLPTLQARLMPTRTAFSAKAPPRLGSCRAIDILVYD